MIHMLNIKKQFDGIRDEVVKSVTEVLEGGQYILGPKVRETPGIKSADDINDYRDRGDCHHDSRYYP